MAFPTREFRRLCPFVPGSIACISAAGGIRLLSTADVGGSGEFSASRSAYEVLGVLESSSFAEIKASFRKLAKETHPDIVTSGSPDDDAAAAASHRFLQILAAYEILSDSKKRAHYDSYLLSQREIMQKQCGFGRTMHTYNSSLMMEKQSNVVKWLKWYKLSVDDIIMERRVAAGSSYFDKLENELYSAIRMAYYGPIIESMELLPDCFEAEERSANETSEVLHLVSGRDLFGIVYVANGVPELSHICHEKLSSFNYSMACGVHQHVREPMVEGNCARPRVVDVCEKKMGQDTIFESDAYKDLELHIFGRVVAAATRSPRCRCIESPTEDLEDHIHVFLTTDRAQDSGSHGSSGQRTLLGTIIGLGTSDEEGSCFVYDRTGVKTHVIMKHRTFLVKHMHWYQVHSEASTCECRSSRARLPPSKYWLFEPRSSLHDIGGWYIETFGREKKGKTIPSRRQWDSVNDHSEKRLHPAMYLLALAYRTLDLEHARRTRQTIRDFVELNFFSILRWWQKFL